MGVEGGGRVGNIRFNSIHTLPTLLPIITHQTLQKGKSVAGGGGSRQEDNESGLGDSSGAFGGREKRRTNEQSNLVNEDRQKSREAICKIQQRATVWWAKRLGVAYR